MSTTVTTNPALDGLRVVDAMHAGVITCRPGDTLRTVARIMNNYRVHAVLVTEHRFEDEHDGWGIVSDLALLRASEGASVDELTAAEIAATPVLSVSSSNELGPVAHLMVERELTHLVVVEGHSKRPVGVLSTLDIARALAGYADPHRL
jgi:CBS domain-containing protein